MNNYNYNHNYNPKIWGPHYWFFIHTTALTYPNNPSDSIKKKYYELIINMPMFIPDHQTSLEFEQLLNDFPVMPYLDNTNSFVKWTVLIHNEINKKLKKQNVMSLERFYTNYYDMYLITQNDNNYYAWKQKAIYITVMCILLGLIYYTF